MRYSHHPYTCHMSAGCLSKVIQIASTLKAGTSQDQLSFHRKACRGCRYTQISSCSLQILPKDDVTLCHSNSNVQGTKTQSKKYTLRLHSVKPHLDARQDVKWAFNWPGWLASLNSTETKSRWATSSRDDPQHLDQTLQCYWP